MSGTTDINRYKIIATSHVFITNKKGQILLQKRYNTGYQDGKYSLVGGHLEENETIKQAAVREAAEEIGVVFTEDELSFRQVLHRRKENEADHDRLDFFFQSFYDGELQILEQHKSNGLEWFDPACLPGNIVPYIKDFILKNGVAYNEFGW